jgi:hypothetical protein
MKSETAESESALRAEIDSLLHKHHFVERGEETEKLAEQSRVYAGEISESRRAEKQLQSWQKRYEEFLNLKMELVPTTREEKAGKYRQSLFPILPLLRDLKRHLSGLGFGTGNNSGTSSEEIINTLKSRDESVAELFSLLRASTHNLISANSAMTLMTVLADHESRENQKTATESTATTHTTVVNEEVQNMLVWATARALLIFATTHLDYPDIPDTPISQISQQMEVEISHSPNNNVIINTRHHRPSVVLFSDQIQLQRRLAMIKVAVFRARPRSHTNNNNNKNNDNNGITISGGGPISATINNNNNSNSNVITTHTIAEDEEVSDEQGSDLGSDSEDDEEDEEADEEVQRLNSANFSPLSRPLPRPRRTTEEVPDSELGEHETALQLIFPSGDNNNSNNNTAAPSRQSKSVAWHARNNNNNNSYLGKDSLAENVFVEEMLVSMRTPSGVQQEVHSSGLKIVNKESFRVEPPLFMRCTNNNNNNLSQSNHQSSNHNHHLTASRSNLAVNNNNLLLQSIEKRPVTSRSGVGSESGDGMSAISMNQRRVEDPFLQPKKHVSKAVHDAIPVYLQRRIQMVGSVSTPLLFTNHNNHNNSNNNHNNSSHQRHRTNNHSYSHSHSHIYSHSHHMQQKKHSYSATQLPALPK